MYLNGRHFKQNRNIKFYEIYNRERGAAVFLRETLRPTPRRENSWRGTGIKCFRAVYSADILHLRQNYVSHIRKTNTSNSNRPHRYSEHTRLAPSVRRTLKSYSNGGNVIFQCKFSMVSRHASIYQRLRVWRLLSLRRVGLQLKILFERLHLHLLFVLCNIPFLYFANKAPHLLNFSLDVAYEQTSRIRRS